MSLTAAPVMRAALGRVPQIRRRREPPTLFALRTDSMWEHLSALATLDLEVPPRGPLGLGDDPSWRAPIARHPEEDEDVDEEFDDDEIDDEDDDLDDDLEDDDYDDDLDEDDDDLDDDEDLDEIDDIDIDEDDDLDEDEDLDGLDDDEDDDLDDI